MPIYNPVTLGVEFGKMQPQSRLLKLFNAAAPFPELFTSLTAWKPLNCLTYGKSNAAEHQAG